MAEHEAQVEYLYKEYERLQGVVNAYSHSSFDDFKLLGALGVVLGWEPLASATLKPASAADTYPYLLLGGFLAVLVISAVIAVRDLLKQSLMIFNHLQLKDYERELRALLGQEGRGTFCGTDRWAAWFNGKHARVAGYFYRLYSLALIGFPTAILALQPASRWLALIYLAAALVVTVFPTGAMRILYGEFAAGGARETLPTMK